MSHSNRPGDNPLPAASATAAQTAASNSATPNATAPDTKSNTSLSYQALETKFKQIAKVATDLLPAANTTPKTDKDFYAISYGLILIDTLIKDTSMIADTAKNLPLICNKSGFVDSSMSKFSDIIKQISNIRNMLSDHFIRIPSKMQGSLFNELDYDLERLGNFAATETQNNEGCKLGTINSIFKNLITIQNLNVAYKDRVSYLLSSLERIDNIKQQYNSHNESDKIKDQYAISMLYIVAGTCAREISAEAARKPLPLSLDPALTQLGEIVKIRTDLGHYSNLGMDTKKFEEKILNINNANFTNAINSEINILYNIADLTKKSPYQKKYFIQPPSANAATATASHQQTISPIDALKAQLAAAKQTAAAQHPPISDSKNNNPSATFTGPTATVNFPSPGTGKGASASIIIASGELSDTAEALENRKKTMLLGLKQSSSLIISTLYDIQILMDNLPFNQMNEEEKKFRNKLVTKINELVGIEINISQMPNKTVDSQIVEFEKLSRLIKAPEVSSLLATFAQSFKSKFEKIAIAKVNPDITMQNPPANNK